jgi:ABC-type nitrate/sulfonate/bicarbonate transport system ATPase subunit
MQTKVEAPATEPVSRQGTRVAVTGVTRRFQGRRRNAGVEALAGVDLQVGPGEVLGIVGPSGCGKSTLLELIAGLQEPDGGTIEVGGESSAAARLGSCSYMPQRDLLLPWRDALGNAALALECQGVTRKEARRRAAPLLERFGLGEFEGARPAELSGGMRQRVAFMRTLLPGRPVLLLDEPFASLDSITRASMQAWLSDALAAEPRTVVLVTHDVEEALFLSDRVAVLSARPGTVMEELSVPLERPRDRRAAVTDPHLARLRERALEVLGQ